MEKPNTPSAEDLEARAAERAELDEIESDLLHKLHDKRSRWSELYMLMDKVESGSLWRAGGFSSMTKWLEHLARLAGCQIQYLWRVKKAGKFYKAYADAEQAAGRVVAPVDEVRLGDEMLADLDRISDGKPERAREYVAAALGGTLTKAKVKQMVKATASAKRTAKAAGKEQGGGVDGVTAADIMLALNNPGLFVEEWGEFVDEHHSRDGHFTILAEFPVQTGTSDHARRMDALAISQLTCIDMYSVGLDMVEIKVTENDLRRDTKHLEYEPFVDRCWFAVPLGLKDAALDAAPEGWGVIIYYSDKKWARVARRAEKLPGVMRSTTIATALGKMLPVPDPRPALELTFEKYGFSECV